MRIVRINSKIVVVLQMRVEREKGPAVSTRQKADLKSMIFPNSPEIFFGLNNPRFGQFNRGAKRFKKCQCIVCFKYGWAKVADQSAIGR